jgi:hypothetical protein
MISKMILRLIFFLSIIMPCTLGSANAAEEYLFKIGKGDSDFPVEFKDFGPDGIADLVVFGDSVFSIEESRVHVVGLKGGKGRYFPIPVRQQENPRRLVIINKDTAAVVFHYTSKRNIGIYLISTQNGKALDRSEYCGKDGCDINFIGLEAEQGSFYTLGKLYIPVIDIRYLGKESASIMIFSLTSGKYDLVSKKSFFKERYEKSKTIISFCDGTTSVTRISPREYFVRINDKDEIVTLSLEMNLGLPEIPCKLDCHTMKLWYWQTTKNDMVKITGIQLMEKSPVGK